MPTILDNTDIDSVVKLSSVTKAIYIMQNIENSLHFRFGGIGVQEETVNTAIRRLGQCVSIEKKIIKRRWKYFSIAYFPETTSSTNVKKYEKMLKDQLFAVDNQQMWRREGSKDGFYGIGNIQDIENKLHEIMQSVTSN